MARKLNDKTMKMGQGGHNSRFGGVREKPKNLKATSSRLVKYISRYKMILIFTVIAVLLLTIIRLSSNVLIEKVVGSLGEYDFKNSVWTKAPDKSIFINSLIALATLYFGVCIFQYISSLLSVFLALKISQKMRNDLFAKIVKYPVKYVDTHPHGDIMSRVTNDIDNVVNAVAQSFTSLISGILTIIGCLGIMIYYSPLLTLVSLISLVLSMVIAVLMSKFMRPLFVKQQATLGLLNAQTEEMVSGCKTVIAYNHQQEAIDEFNELSDNLCKTNMKAQIGGGSLGPLMNFIGNTSYFLVCFFGALFVIKGIGNTLLGAALTTSIVVMFITTTKQFTRPINEMASTYTTLITAIAGAERVFAMFDEDVEDFTGKEVVDVNNLKGNIEFNNVYFSYDGNHVVLQDFSLNIESGQKIALVGATGSGKTTIVNLLLRFYDIDSGSIKIDGIDIKDMSKKDLRDSISIVLQDAVLFEDSIENNVKYSKENATTEEFENALRTANCYKFVNRLPDKEKTILSQDATNISLGQKQLLTIARAVLADPKILILDEATSSVDTRTEKKIQDAMVKLMQNRTSIIIAHRLSTIQDADLIVVLDGGKVVEKGNHQQLLEKDGVYKRLYQTQFKGIDI